MKPMIWHPESKDEKINQYLDRVNHAPYGMIIFMILGLFGLFTFAVLLGVF
jgi:F0F1-type ATP synthase assembly protein I